TCIYELYNEDMKSGPLSEKNWGLFNANGAPKKGKTPDSYHFDGVASISTTDPKLVSCNFTQAGGEDLRLDLGGLHRRRTLALGTPNRSPPLSPPFRGRQRRRRPQVLRNPVSQQVSSSSLASRTQ
ncbi:hypothetical protein S245_050858, partial [Arachis hypogaea]